MPRYPASAASIAESSSGPAPASCPPRCLAPGRPCGCPVRCHQRAGQECRGGRHVHEASAAAGGHARSQHPREVGDGHDVRSEEAELFIEVGSTKRPSTVNGIVDEHVEGALSLRNIRGGRCSRGRGKVRGKSALFAAELCPDALTGLVERASRRAAITTSSRCGRGLGSIRTQSRLQHPLQALSSAPPASPVYARGSPRPRVAMMFRLISLVPPSIVFATDRRYMYLTRPRIGAEIASLFASTCP